MRSVCRAILLFCLLPSPLVAQSAVSDDAQIDAMLTSTTVTWEQTTWMVGRAAGTFDESVQPQEAVRLAADAGWCPKGTDPGAAIQASEFAYLLTKALDIPGGVFYSLFPGPRYAFRELVYRRILPPGLAPDSKLSGQEIMIYLQNAQTWKDVRS